jgi:hypothetical protein
MSDRTSPGSRPVLSRSQRRPTGSRGHQPIGLCLAIPMPTWAHLRSLGANAREPRGVCKRNLHAVPELRGRVS